MDTGTGQIYEFKNQEDLDEAVRTRGLVALKGKPKKNCKRCYGLGHLGKDTVTNKYILCPCVKKEKVDGAC